MYKTDLPIRAVVEESHQAAIEAYAKPGAWLDADTRIKVLAEARSARQCNLCQRRKTALSPYTVDGDHDTGTDLSPEVVEVIHRLITDSGRLTQSWFSQVTSGELTQETYVEVVGLVATSIILDSFARGIGVDLLQPGEPESGEPSWEKNPGVVDDGAWLPIMDVPQEPTDVILPSAPNILRAMGLVMSAVAHFFGVMRAHYALANLDIEINRSQTELIASRVSSLNQCFY